ncbi:MAG: zinc-ribbon domain-containing protein [Candidatus Avispirillum sp.]
MAKFCEKCGTPMEDEAVFCPNCGTAAAPAVEDPAPVAEETAPAPAVEEPAPAPAVEEPAPEPAPAVVEPAPAVETAAAQEQSGFTYANAPQAPKQEAAPQEPQYRYQPAVQAQPVYQQPQPVYTVYAAPPSAESVIENQTVSTARFFWFRVLFAIPLVGFILSIVMSFAPKNKSFKHFARSYMIMNFIAIGIVLVICIVVMATGGTLAGLYYDILHSM